MTKRTVIMMKLEGLWRKDVGTGKVEKLAIKLAMEMRGGRKGPIEERDRKRMIMKKVLMLMKDKVRDAKEDVKLAKIKFQKLKREMWRVIQWESRVGREILEVLQGEISFEWKEKFQNMLNSVNHLIQKHRKQRKEEVPATWREIKISDLALGAPLPLPAPVIGEGVRRVTEAAREVLQLPPPRQLCKLRSGSGRSKWRCARLSRPRPGGLTWRRKGSGSRASRQGRRCRRRRGDREMCTAPRKEPWGWQI